MKKCSKCGEVKALGAALPRDFTTKDWRAAQKFFNNKCAYCGAKGKMTQDHFIPVKKGGGYTRDNIVPACGSCNCSKGAKDPYKWLVTKKLEFLTYVRVKQYLESRL